MYERYLASWRAAYGSGRSLSDSVAEFGLQLEELRNKVMQFSRLHFSVEETQENVESELKKISAIQKITQLKEDGLPAVGA